MGKSKAPERQAGESPLPLLVAIFVVFLSLLALLYFLRRRRYARNGVLLTGLCDSGKTLLYSRLVHRKFVNTQTSIKENVGSYLVNGKTLRVVDIPGHERLRDTFFETYKDTSKGIVYIVDSQTIRRDVRDVAEFLYNVLSDPVVNSNSPAVLILCNKQDEQTALDCEEIREILEKEINTLRVTKASQLESVDPNGKRLATLGRENETFTFDSVPQYKVRFVNGYGTNGDGDCDIGAVEDWLLKL